MREYNRVTNEDLIALLQGFAEKLGHTPTKKDVPDWIKTLCHSRFGKWCYALEAAGVKVPSKTTLARRARNKAKYRRLHRKKADAGERETENQGNSQEAL